MELKEAKKKLNNFILETNKIKDTSEEWHGYMNDELHELKRTIETVLQALDNSIPKEKVLEKMKKLDDLANDPEQEYYYANYRYTMNNLEDLLGEDSSNIVTKIFRSKASQAPIEIKEKLYEF